MLESHPKNIPWYPSNHFSGCRLNGGMLDQSVGQLAGACGIGMYYYYKAKDNHQYDKKFVLLSIKFCKYRYFSIYAVNVETHEKNRESKNRVNRSYLVVLKGRKIG